MHNREARQLVLGGIGYQPDGCNSGMSVVSNYYALLYWHLVLTTIVHELKYIGSWAFVAETRKSSNHTEKQLMIGVFIG
jgi:hypothetical protein